MRLFIILLRITDLLWQVAACLYLSNVSVSLCPVLRFLFVFASKIPINSSYHMTDSWVIILYLWILNFPLRLNVSTQKLSSPLEHFPMMSHLIGSHRWCQCLLCVYSAPAWEISHQATTWTWAWWVDSTVGAPGPHLRLICLAAENNEDVIRNLAPCVKYGKGSWLSSLNSVPFSLFAANFRPRLYKIPGDSLLRLLKFCCCGKNSSPVSPLLAARRQTTCVKWLMAAMHYEGL